MKLKIKRGTTSKRVRVFVQDSSSNAGAGLTGVAYNTSGLSWYYIREDQSSATQVTLANATVGSFTSGGFKEVDATNMPGVYELGVPDAALSAGNAVHMILKGAANMVPCLVEIELDGFDYDAGSVPDLGDGAINAASMASDTNTYQAKVWFFDDNGGTTDRYAVAWFKNGQPVTAGITSPTLQVIKASDGTDLIASSAMTQIGSTGLYKYDATSGERTASGAAYMAKVQATIDSATRTWYQPVGRDST
jgi:hypothetical protein